WPSYLDNTVAGGITSGETPRSSILREFAEEASLSPDVISPLLRQVGVVTYCTKTKTGGGWLSPEVQYVYDAKLPSPTPLGSNDDEEKDDGDDEVEVKEGRKDVGIVPTTNPDDGEVESFELMGVDEVVERMWNGEFKPNCALVMIDFLIRHGLITAESDVRYLEISRRLHRELGTPMPV
ncbi:hypothetical protein JCM10212_002128, partial [Sporobolomyces blumeae]